LTSSDESRGRKEGFRKGDQKGVLDADSTKNNGGIDEKGNQKKLGALIR